VNSLRHTLHHVRFETFMALKIEFVVFWVVVPCSMVIGCCEDGGSTVLWKMLVSNHHTAWCRNPENHKFCTVSCLRTLHFWTSDLKLFTKWCNQVCSTSYTLLHYGIRHSDIVLPATVNCSTNIPSSIYVCLTGLWTLIFIGPLWLILSSNSE
jgi:hypothetical protein